MFTSSDEVVVFQYSFFNLFADCPDSTCLFEILFTLVQEYFKDSSHCWSGVGAGCCGFVPLVSVSWCCFVPLVGDSSSEVDFKFGS